MTDRPGPYRGIVFLHIPKTGGTSMRKALQSFCERPLRMRSSTLKLENFSDEDLANYDLIAGHAPACQTERPVLENYMRVVVLRDPLDRFFSTFNFAKVSVARGKAGPPNQFAAKVEPFEYFASHFGISRHHQLSFLGLDIGERQGMTPLAKLLKRAKERLSTMVVGVMPHLDSLLAYTANEYGCMVQPKIKKLNVTPEHLKTSSVSEEELAIMRHTLRFDYELFHFACERARCLYGAPEPAKAVAPSVCPLPGADRGAAGTLPAKDGCGGR